MQKRSLNSKIFPWLLWLGQTHHTTHSHVDEHYQMFKWSALQIHKGYSRLFGLRHLLQNRINRRFFLEIYCTYFLEMAEFYKTCDAFLYRTPSCVLSTYSTREIKSAKIRYAFTLYQESWSLRGAIHLRLVLLLT